MEEKFRFLSKIIAVLLFVFSLQFTALRVRSDRLPPQTVLNEVKNGVVKIEFDAGEESKIGTGAVISEDGYILTARHILEDKFGTFVKDFKVIDQKGKSYRGTPVTSIKEKDLAVIKVNNENMTPINIGSSEDLEILDYVMTIGYPYGFFTVTEGKVSGWPDKKGLPSLQFTAPLAEGSSGGPVINENGNLVGLVMGRISEKSGFSFAVPIDKIKKYLPSYEDELTFSASSLAFGRDGTMYFFLGSGNLESWKPGLEETRVIKKNIENPSDIALFERYVYYTSTSKGGGIKTYSTFEEEIIRVLNEMERPENLALSSNGDLYFTKNNESLQQGGLVSVWRYDSGNIEEVVRTDCPIGGIGIERNEKNDFLYVGCKSKRAKEGKTPLYRIDLSTGETVQYKYDLPSNLDLDVSEGGVLFYLGEGDPRKVYLLDPREPVTIKKLTEGPYVSGAWDRADNLYLSGEEKISILRDVQK